MNKSRQAFVSGVSVFFFISALFCCSFCRLAEARTDAQRPTPSVLSGTLAKMQHSCCPTDNKASHSQRKCQELNSSPLLQLEKFNDLGHKILTQVSQLTLLFPLIGEGTPHSLIRVASFSPPQFLPESVPIYLFDRALRI